MKTNLHSLVGITLLSLTMISCQRDADLPKSETIEESLSAKNEAGLNIPTTSNSPYSITLVPGRVNNLVPGGFEWVWKVVNLNPGNGNGGLTFQGLSHWGFSPEACVRNGIVSAAYSTNLTNWTYFTPSFGPDPTTVNCWPAGAPTSLLKFDFGTNGAAPSYYRLVLNKSHATQSTLAVYKSGKKTGCGTIVFDGISCANGPTGGGVFTFD